MAVFPDRIVLKNSSDDNATIVAAIESGGTDEITQGEVVLGIDQSIVKFFTKSGNGSIVSLGSTQLAAAIIAETPPATRLDSSALLEGDLWWVPSTEILYVYYSSAWEPISSGSGGGSGSIRGDGGDFDSGQVGTEFALGVYGGGDFDVAGIDYPIEALSGDSGPDAGSFD